MLPIIQSDSSVPASAFVLGRCSGYFKGFRLGNIQEYLKERRQSGCNNFDADSLNYLDFSEGEVLEINQLASYFNYVNRMVVGLGVNTEGDIIGLSPNDNENPKDWSHS